MRFYVAGKPVPQGSLMVIRGNIVHVKSKELMAWRKAIADSCKALCKAPLTGAVEIYLHFGIEKPKTVNRSEPSVKPDLDKYIRAVLDGLTGTAYADDQQVTYIEARKSYQKISGVIIELRGSSVDGLEGDGNADTLFRHLGRATYEKIINGK
jgi:Holliday junction resolvase RusA-like endonuclease